MSKISTWEELFPDWRDNDIIVYNVLVECYPNSRTRPQLGKETKLARTSIFDALDRLIIKGLVEKIIEDRTTTGRPKSWYKIIPQNTPAVMVSKNLEAYYTNREGIK